MTDEALTEDERGLSTKELAKLAPFEVTDKQVMVWLPDGRCYKREGRTWLLLDA